ncbi:hypothetical protein N0V90_000230 [Kalmusia sp. IMI 367209]|nr:hypothetical protein N0V90_000230 [Kalmusia sp. IMI 367209]
MTSPDREGMAPYVERYGPLLQRPIHQRGQQRDQRSTGLPDKFADLRVGAPASDRALNRKHRLFKYTRLPGQDYIRLLHLKPVSSNVSELRGSLKIHKLDEHCSFEAISYAWGEFPQFSQVLFLDNNKLLKITDNLYAALMAYSRPDNVRVMWADAVCINQADTDEKTQQVALMADIYSKAKIVQVWLTLASRWTTDAMSFLKNLSSRADRFGISKEVGHPRLIESWPTVNVTSDEAEKLIDDAIQNHVDYLLFRSWFNRVWVVQEVALAADLTVSCGHTNLKWIDMARALEVLRGAYRKIPYGEERSSMEGLKAAWGLVQHRDQFRLLDRYFRRDHHRLTNLAGRHMSNRACSDDRDRVYAMLSMTKSHIGMVPDYTKTVAEAYTEFTRRYSPNSQLYWAGLARRRPTNFDTVVAASNPDINANDCQPPPLDITSRDYLPSWVPEFRPSLNLAWASPFTGRYGTASLAPFFFLPHPSIPTVMHATGIVFDLIQTCSPVFNMKAPHCFQSPQFFFPLLNLLNNVPPDIELQPSSEPHWMILGKALTGGVGDCEGAESLLSKYHAIRPLQHLGPGSLPWLTRIWDCFATHCLSPTGEVFQRILLTALGTPRSHPLSPAAEIALDFLNYLANILIPNRLFITSSGYVGLASKILQAGDMVAIVNGCHMPYVVRSVPKVKWKDEEIDWALKVVGPCYLHGIMRGEILNRGGKEKGVKDKKDRDGEGQSETVERLEWVRLEGDEADSLMGWLTFV